MDNTTGSVLQDPLSISDLIKDGSHFQINANFEEDIIGDDFLDELNLNLSDEEEEKPKIISPWEKSFDELRSLMVEVNEHIYKRITKPGNPNLGKPEEKTRVVIEYNAYFEKETEPFDSSFMRGDVVRFFCGNGDVLEGLEKAVMTMQKGEEAQFVISYHLLFHEMGCPPRIKPKADGLFIIKLVHFEKVGNEDAVDEVPYEDRNKYSVVIEKVKEVHLKGLDFFKHRKYASAVRSFHKAVQALEFCQLANDEEQEEQRKFLVKLYTNLAICHNNLNQPKKTCCMINEIARISNIKENCKALFHEGRALLMLGEFKRAKGCLLNAQKLEPNNLSITAELRLLAEKYETYVKNERNIWKKAMGVIDSANSKMNEKQEEVNEFKTEIKKYIEEFKESDKSSELTLPHGLSQDELAIITELTESMNLKLHINDVHEPKTYTIKKI